MRKIIAYVVVIAVLGLSTFITSKQFSSLTQLYVSVLINNGWIILISVAGYYLILRRYVSFFENFFHELTHLLFSLLFFERVSSFFASQTHGEITTESSFMNIITALSPFYFPVITFLLIAVWPMSVSEPLKVIVPASYGVFWAIMVRQAVNHKHEVLSFSWYGLVFILIMNFWISLYVFTWYADKTELLIHLLKIKEYGQLKI